MKEGAVRLRVVGRRELDVFLSVGVEVEHCDVEIAAFSGVHAPGLSLRQQRPKTVE